MRLDARRNLSLALLPNADANPEPHYRFTLPLQCCQKHVQETVPQAHLLRLAAPVENHREDVDRKHSILPRREAERIELRGIPARQCSVAASQTFSFCLKRGCFLCRHCVRCAVFEALHKVQVPTFIQKIVLRRRVKVQNFRPNQNKQRPQLSGGALQQLQNVPARACVSGRGGGGGGRGETRTHMNRYNAEGNQHEKERN
jgi:hypothetical protein